MCTTKMIGHLRGTETSDTVEVKHDPLWWQEQGLQETATGYGSKLTSPYKVFFLGRWYRVYYTCHSNVASHWIKAQGETYFFTMIN